MTFMDEEMRAIKRKCPFCAEEIQAEAIKCKHCGEKLPSDDVDAARRKLVGDATAVDRTKGGPFWGGVLTVIGVLFFIGYCSSQMSPDTTSTSASTAATAAATTSDEPAPAQGHPIQTYTAAQLYAMFHANEIKANQTIGDSIVRFSGTVTKIEQSDFSHTPELTFSADDGNEFDDFEANLNASETTAAAELVKGQQITLQCDKVSMPVEVAADGCVIVH